MKDKHEDYITLESETIQLLESACYEGEEFDRDARLQVGNHTFVTDGCFHNGCRQLEFPRRTIVEIKMRLRWDTLYRIYDKLQTLNQVSREKYTYVVLCTDADVGRLQYQDLLERSGGSLRLLSINELQQKVSVRKPNQNDPGAEAFSRARKAFLKGPNTLFLGAGVSMSAGFPDWTGLIRALMDKTDGVLSKEQYDVLADKYNVPLIVLGRIIEGLMKDRGKEISDVIHQYFLEMQDSSKFCPQSKLITTIAEMIKCKDNQIAGIITYNYDDLIEQELDRLLLNNNSVYGLVEPGPDFPVYHVHGVVPISENRPKSPIVFSEHDYHDVYRKSYSWSNVEQLHALQRSHCFFIGLSMTDPNLRRLLDIAQENGMDREAPRHFAFMNKLEYINDKQGEIYCKCQEKIMRELGVEIIWYCDHDNLPSILEHLLPNAGIKNLYPPECKSK